ncbi:MAG: PAS domain S-box protein [Bacteroidales bacterium]|nr:PAS domain S-box protein [Bacteroidales bacterium]
MSAKPVKILFLENNKTDVQRIMRELIKEGYEITGKTVESKDDFEHSVKSFLPDIVLCDYNLTGYDGIYAIQYLVKQYDHLPVIMISESLDEESVLDVIKNGVWDYVSKTHLSRIGPAVTRVLQIRNDKIQKINALKQLKESEMKYRSLYEHAGTGLFQSTLDGTRFTSFNQSFANILGYSKDQLINVRPIDIWYRPEERNYFVQKILENKELKGYKARLKHVLGSNVYVLISARFFPADEVIEGSITDITQAQRDELLRDIIYNISESATTKGSLNELLITVNFELNRLIKSKNLLIGIVNELSEKLELPYMRDTHKVVSSFPLEHTISKLVIHSGQPMFLKREQLVRLKEEGKIKVTRKLPAVWLGVPLSVGEKIFGILALQDYDNPKVFTDEDMRLLMYVAKQTSLAIHKKQYEEEIRRLKMGIEQSPLSVVFTDPDAKIEYVNHFFENLTGYSIKEVKGKNPRILKSGHTPKSTYKSLWDTVTKGNVWKGEFLNRKKNGELYWEYAVISPVYDEHGKLMNYIGLKEDITQKKEVEAALHESEEKFKTITEQANDGIIMLDSEMKIVFWNKAFEKLTGYSFQKLEQLPFTDIARYENGPIVITPEKIKRFSETGQADSIGKALQIQIKTNEGKWVNTETSLASIKLKNQWYAVSIIRDITLRKQYEKGLEEARKKAEESDQLKNTFLMNISHELRTPLNAIIGFSEIIEHSFINPEVYDHATNIHYSGIQLLRIIEDILNLSLIESGNLSFNIKTFPVKNLVRTIREHYDTLNKKYKKDNVQFTLHFPQKLKDKKIDVDENYVNYLIGILIDNAMKFTQNGSIDVFLESNNNYMIFRVRDTGVGIPQNKKELIFDKFRQIEETLTRRYGGTGVGLTIAKNIIDLMNGNIHVISEPGKGSEFFVKLPGLKEENEKNVLEKKETLFQPDTLKGIKILVAEDEELNFLLLKGLLAKYGAHLVRACNGQEAIDLYHQNLDTKLVLMDIRMPVMDGLEATEKLKKIRPDLPVIAVTAYSRQEDKTKAFQAGCDEFLTKPVDRDKLNEAIGKFLSD